MFGELTHDYCHKGRMKRRVFQEDEVYTTPLLPGFELPLARLFALANSWSQDEEDDNAE